MATVLADDAPAAPGWNPLPAGLAREHQCDIIADMIKRLLCRWSLHAFYVVDLDPSQYVQAIRCKWCGKQAIEVYGLGLWM